MIHHPIIILGPCERRIKTGDEIGLIVMEDTSDLVLIITTTRDDKDQNITCQYIDFHQ